MKHSLRTALSLLLTCTLCLCLLPVASASDTATLTFTDKALEAKVRMSMGIPEGSITVEDVKWIDALNLSNETTDGLGDDQLIRDISDLRQFPSLSWLSLINNAVTDLSPLMSLTNLKGLDIGNNAVTDLSPLVGQPLEELILWGNAITDLTPLGDLQTLKTLMANNNAIHDFSPLAGLTELKALYLRMNASSNYSALASLAPQLSDKDFDIFTTPYDPAEVIAFADPVLEQKVRASMNLPQGPITAGDAAYATALDLSNPWGGDVPDSDRFADISPLRYFVNLTELRMTRNNVQDLSAIAEITGLEVLQLSDNDVADFTPIAGLKQLKYLTLDSRGRDIGVLGGLTALVSLEIGNGNKVLPDWLPDLTMLESFTAAGGEITDIAILAQCPQLTAVNLGWNRITDLTPLKGLTLTRLYLNQNAITDVSVLAGMPLTTLFLDGNPIADYGPIRAVYDTLQEKDFEPFYLDDIPADPLTFADANFETALRNALNIHDRPITTRDAYSVTRLEVYSEKVGGTAFSDISPLTAFVNLEEFRVNANTISDLSPLSGLAKLRGLDLGFQRISDLSPLSGLTELRWLGLRNNQIVDLKPLRSLTKLDSLDLCENQVVDLTPLQGLANLTRLLVENNRINDFGPADVLLPHLSETDIPKVPDDVPDEPLPNLDAALAPLLSQALGIPQQALTQRRVYRISNLFIQGPVAAQVETVDISALASFQKLQRLDINQLPVRDLSPLTGLEKLNWLVVADAKLTDITPVGQMKGLKGLELQNNQIADIAPLKSLTDLEFVNVSGNRITDMSPLLMLPKLTTLFMSNNPAGDVSAFADIAARLHQKDFDPNMLLDGGQQAGQANGEGGMRTPDNPAEPVTFKDKKLETAVRAMLGIQGRDITLADTYAVTTLDFTQAEGGGQKFKDITPLASFVNLEELRLIGNGIKNIGSLVGLNRLQRLQLDFQAIADIGALAGMPLLDYVSIKENKIASIESLSGNEHLRCLDLTGNKIKDITPLATCGNLQDLYISSNQIADLTPLTQRMGLTTLHLVNNKIKDVAPLSGLTNLRGLMLGGNKIKDYSPLAALYPNLTDKDFEVQ